MCGKDLILYVTTMDRMELDQEIWVASQSHVQARLHGEYSRTFCVFTLPFKQNAASSPITKLYK